MLIDTHAHLTDVQFFDIEEVLKKSQEMGVKFFITSGFDFKSSINAVEFAKKHKNVYASIGIYPEYASDFDDNISKKIEELGKEKKVVAIGEIGLQFTQGTEDKNLQIEVFEKQIEIAYILKKPIIIHCRDAIGALLEVLKKNKDKLCYGGTVHCFNGSSEVAKEIIKLGLKISVGGVSTFKNATSLKEVLKNIPLENLLLETDCPYLTPHPFRGKRNSPEFIPTIAENLAQLKNISVDEVAKTTSANAVKLFKLEEE